MPISSPAISWPSDLSEAGPAEDPSILLIGRASIGPAAHRVVAVRIAPHTMAIDYRPDLDEDIYADYLLDEMVDELTFLDDLDASVLVPMADGYYAVWMTPHVARTDD